MGKTDGQYKGMLIDELNYWQECLELAQKLNSDPELLRLMEKQIARINAKLKV